MVVAVTGAAGHIGANLVRALLNAGRSVRALIHRDRRGIEGLDIEVAAIDLLDPTSLDTAFSGIETVYHLAVCLSFDRRDAARIWQTNVVGTANVVRACLDRGVRRLLHFSSIDALSSEGGILNENTPLENRRQAPLYNRSKAEADRIVAAAISEGLDAVFLTPSAVMGPWDFKPSQLGRVLIEHQRGALPLLLAAGHDWVDARDVAQGALAVESDGLCGHRYFLTGHWLSLPALFKRIHRVQGIVPPAATLPLWLAKAAVPFMELAAHMAGRTPLYTRAALFPLGHGGRVSHSKAATAIGYRPRPIEETIRDTYAWFRRHGYLAGVGQRVQTGRRDNSR
jgi:dihydroflavonol-4-reductase